MLVVVQREPHLKQVLLTLRPPGILTRRPHRWHHQRDQSQQQHQHHYQLDHGETA